MYAGCSDTVASAGRFVRRLGRYASVDRMGRAQRRLLPGFHTNHSCGHTPCKSSCGPCGWRGAVGKWPADADPVPQSARRPLCAWHKQRRIAGCGSADTRCAAYGAESAVRRPWSSRSRMGRFGRRIGSNYTCRASYQRHNGDSYTWYDVFVGCRCCGADIAVSQRRTFA
jgi:hypothetical protein